MRDSAQCPLYTLWYKQSSISVITLVCLLLVKLRLPRLGCYSICRLQRGLFSRSGCFASGEKVETVSWKQLIYKKQPSLSVTAAGCQTATVVDARLYFFLHDIYFADGFIQSD